MPSPASVLLTRINPTNINKSSNIAYAYMGIVLQLADMLWQLGGEPSWTGQNPIDAVLLTLSNAGIDLDGSAATTHLKQHLHGLRELYARGL